MAITYHAGRRIQATSTDFGDNGAGIPAVSGGWKEVGRTTLGSAGDTISVASLPAKRYYMILQNPLASGGSNTTWNRLNNDSGSNYGRRISNNGGSDTTNTSATEMRVDAWGGDTDKFFVNYIANKSDKEKLVIGHMVDGYTAGAGTAPQRSEYVFKWANTSSDFSRIDALNQGGGDYASGSEVVVLGWDSDDTHTTNFWEELASVDITSASNLSSGTITAKKYLWYQYHLKLGATQNGDITYNNDTGSNYAIRYSDDGGTDGTATSVSLAGNSGGGTSGETIFANVFVINNSSNEKLAISYFMNSESAGAGTAPTRREAVHKWANTSSQITEIDVTANTGNFTSGSLRVWGSN